MKFYDFSVERPDGTKQEMKDFEGKVVMVVNTATGCGFTPQYENLQKMYERYHNKGFEIVDIPCNQFAGQAPGTDEEIHEFCTLNYNTKFPQMKKSEVNGDNALDLYKFLKNEKGFKGFGDSPEAKGMEEFLSGMDKDYAKNDDIKWNFTKFIIDREGHVVKRFEPTIGMEKVESFTASLL